MILYSFTSVTENEKIVLKTFDKYNELLMPEWALKEYFTKGQVRQLINELERKHLLIKDKPYRLTNLGIYIRKKYNLEENS